MRWKLTEQKYLKLRKWTLILCALTIVIYALLLRHLFEVNPMFFTYHPIDNPNPGVLKLQSMLNWVVTIGWIVVIFFFYKEVKKNPNHWFWKAKDYLENLNDKWEKEELEERKKKDEDKIQ